MQGLLLDKAISPRGPSFLLEEPVLMDGCGCVWKDGGKQLQAKWWPWDSGRATGERGGRKARMRRVDLMSETPPL